jgi:adenine-specific DNA-methyltransferase
VGKRYEWYALQRCAATYYEDFEKEKIVYQEIVRGPQFHLDTKGHFPEATTFIITGDCLKYLIAVLNSKPFTYLFKKFYAGGGLGDTGYRYKKKFLELVPVVVPADEERRVFEDMVNQILEITSSLDYEPDNPPVKQKQLEQQIDQMVYKLYDLTEEEIKIIENS